MAKTKRGTQRKEGRRRKSSDRQARPGPVEETPAHSSAHLPRPNRPLLVVSIALFGAWVVYLAIVAWLSNS